MWGVGSEMGSFGCVVVIALGVHWGPHGVPFGAAFWGEMGQFWATMGRICRVLGYDWYPWGCVGVCGGVGSEMGTFGCVIVVALGAHWGPSGVPFGAAFLG